MAILDNIAGYWDLSEASGTRADASGIGNTLTDNNTVTGTTGPGAHNASLFTAVNNESLSHIDNAGLSVGNIDFTVSIWVYLTTLIDYQNFCGQKLDTGNQKAWQIYQDDTLHPYTFGVSNDGAAMTYLSSNEFCAASAWHFVVVQHDAVHDTMGISIDNGTLKTQVYAGGVFDSSADFSLGSTNNASYLNGRLALCGFWKRILTVDEITFLYNSGNGRSYADLLPSGIAASNFNQFPKHVLRQPIVQGRLI